LSIVPISISSSSVLRILSRTTSVVSSPLGCVGWATADPIFSTSHLNVKSDCCSQGSSVNQCGFKAAIAARRVTAHKGGTDYGDLVKCVTP
jgi:hypothetical protein